MDDTDIRKRLRELMSHDSRAADGFTLAELRESLGVPESRAWDMRFRAAVRQALADGLLEPCTVTRQTLVGYRQGRPGLRFAQPSRRAAKRR